MRFAAKIPHLLGAAVCVLLITLPAQARTNTSHLQQLRVQAAQFEQQFDWERACVCYESILRSERGVSDIKERYQHCLRRYWQVKRHQDISYRKEVLSLDYGQALRLYRIFLNTLQENALEPKRAAIGRLFHKGMEEFEWALAEPVFCQTHLPECKPADIDTFLDTLQMLDMIDVATPAEAMKQVREIALSAYTYLHLHPGTVIMEFACGACYSLDDYTAYLTPAQLRSLCDTLKGQVVSVGLTPALLGDQIVVGDVTPYSSAAELMPPLQRGDHILSVDGKATDFISSEAVLALLEGPTGTTVQLRLESVSLGDRVVTLQRRPFFLPSVSCHMKDDVTGYIHIACFQDTTLQELDSALLTLAKANMKGLILDLRGNGGGLFEVSIDTARRFLANDLITTTQHSDPKYNATYHSRNPEALTVPMVVLIDSDTASASEVLAGALKDNKRARLVGQTTFGKGCTQCLLQLPPAKGNVPTGGLRLTVAQFFSPKGLPYTGRGVTPHVYIARIYSGDSINTDPQMEHAQVEVRRILAGAN